MLRSLFIGESGDIREIAEQALLFPDFNVEGMGIEVRRKMGPTPALGGGAESLGGLHSPRTSGGCMAQQPTNGQGDSVVLDIDAVFLLIRQSACGKGEGMGSAVDGNARDAKEVRRGGMGEELVFADHGGFVSVMGDGLSQYIGGGAVGIAEVACMNARFAFEDVAAFADFQGEAGGLGGVRVRMNSKGDGAAGNHAVDFFPCEAIVGTIFHALGGSVGNESGDEV